jgi:CRP/FNR family transcriptional regulator, cyclic AMP receptor protein
MQPLPIAGLIRQLKVPLFGSLAADDLAAVAPLLKRKRFAPDQLVFSRGDRADELYIIVSGRMKLSVLAPDGRELTFRTAGPGEVVGEIATLDGSTRSADMTAIRDSELLVLARKSLASLLQSRPAFGLEVIHFLCRRLRDTSEQLESIALYPVEARLARLLLALAGQAGQQPAAPARADVSLAITQTELATMLAASRPKVNGAMRRLEKDGAIRRRGARMSCDLDKLREVAECAC